MTGAAPARSSSSAGVAHIPEDRQKHGLVLAYPLADNLVLSRYDRPPFARGLRRIVRRRSGGSRRAWSREFDVRAPSVQAPTATLSGGNQQKAVVARELRAGPRLLIAAQPTRGVDVGSTEFIHRRIVAARDGGAAVLLVSAELDELLALADRVVVMYRGRITAPARRGRAEPRSARAADRRRRPRTPSAATPSPSRGEWSSR